MSQRIVMIDTVALTGIYGNGPPNDDVGNPPDPEYAKLMWKWIEKTLSEVILSISYFSSFLEIFPNFKGLFLVSVRRTSTVIRPPRKFRDQI